MSLNLRIVIGLLALTCAAGISVQPASAFWGRGQDVLVTLDGQRYTTEDFSRWWAEWQEPGVDFPQTPKPYVDWLLLAREAEHLELDDKPSFREKMAVFLKVRSLMRLQQEEVGDRIASPSSEELWPIYHEEYAPLINLHMVALKTEEDTLKMRQALEAGLPLQEAAATAGVDNEQQQMSETGMLRPFTIPEPIRKVALSLDPGMVGGPVLWQNVRYFLQVVEKQEGGGEDFEKLESTLKEKYVKREADRLTADLLEKLKTKYAVEVDRDLLQRITLESVPEEEADKVVVNIQGQKITAAAFRQLLEQDAKIRGNSFGGEFSAFRDGIVNRMIQQTLLGLESAARNYETTPPLSYTYQFYRQHRMIRELESEMIWPLVEVSSEDVEKEYAQHPDRYLRSPEGVVELARVETADAELAAVLQERLKRGEDYFKAMQLLSPGGIEKKKVPLGHLEPNLREAVKLLAEGQASAGIPVDEKIVFVKVAGEIEQDLLPLPAVEDSIRQRLRQEKFDEILQDIVHRLRERSTIKINEKAWKKAVQSMRGR